MAISDPFRKIFKQNLCQMFYDRLSILSGDMWFLGIGKINAWKDSTGVDNDNLPSKNTNAFKNDIDFWRSSLGFKKINTEDVSIVIPRYDWESGQVYTAYRNTEELFDDSNPSKFYVLVDQERVYKCIDNNFNGASTVAPSHTDAQIRTTSDGYRWKYMYSIVSSKQKFLTTGNPGYMPVEYMQFVKSNDERILQWEIQSAAVTGSIDHIALDKSVRQYVLSDKVLFYDPGNQVVSATGPGATQIIIGGSKIVPQSNYYNNMTLKIEDGLGVGQQRIITNYVYNSNGTATVTLKDPLNFGVTAGTGSDATLYSIIPTVLIEGDGTSNNNTFNSYSSAAEVTVKFFGFGATGYTGQRYLDSIDVTNSGKNYSYANIKVVAGLTFAPGVSGDFSNLGTPVISPYGGHGSNPVKELGGSSIMMICELDGSENSKLTTGNDYRQFAFIKNPLLSNPHSRVYFGVAGLPASFTVGATATQGATGVGGVTGFTISTGKILSWDKGTTGYTGSSYLQLSDISGQFKINGLVNGFPIVQSFTKSVAGTEGRLLQKLKLTPINSNSFGATGDEFVANLNAIGLGCTSQNINPSYANGKVYSWTLEAGTNAFGTLLLENTQGNFTLNEYVYQSGIDNDVLGGPIGKISEIDQQYVPYQTTYNQTLKLKLNYDGVNTFANTSYNLDSSVTGMSGTTVASTGIVVDWTVLTGATTGILSLNNTSNQFSIGNYILYNNSNSSGATISQIVSTPELVYGSGELIHSQNIRPVSRSIEQKEEIKLIVDF